MGLYRFTGNPFVDAGIAGMCAAAGVERPEELDYDRVHSAAERLVRILTSPQALEPRAKPVDPGATSAFATSEMSVFFPNGPHSNPSNKPADKARKYSNQIADLLDQVNQPPASSMTCFACGRPATRAATKMDFPLVDSSERRNFHPSHHPGHPICGRCSLAVQFLPLSTMRTSPDGGLFWFLSSLDPSVAVAPAAELVLPKFEACIAADKRLSLYGDWAFPGRTSAVVNAVVALTGRVQSLGLIEPKYPVRAFFFTNDNRNPEITAIDVPNSLFRYLCRLRVSHRRFAQFVEQALGINGLCAAMLVEDPIVRSCIIWPENENAGTALKGGWYAHALYMKEVLGMQDRYIRTVEQVALRIAKSEEPERELKSIKIEKSPMLWLQQAIAKSLLTREELYALVPPNDHRAASSALDYIAAAAADAIRCRAENENWERWDDESAPEPEQDRHPIITLVEQTGERIFDSGYDPKKLFNGLRTARGQPELRRVWLRALEAGAIGWIDFKNLMPPNDVPTIYAIRDYMIAYLCDRLRGSIELEEIEEPEELVSGTEINIEEEEEWPTLS